MTKKTIHWGYSMLIDTHCHLDMMIKNSGPLTPTSENYQTVKAVIEAAENNNVLKIINIGTDYARSLQSVELSRLFPQVFCAVGIHPCDGTASWQDDFAHIKKLVADKEKNKIIGIGESGLDFYHPGFVVERQKDLFKAHIELALEHNLALVVHTRNAIDETLTVLQQYHNTPLRGVVHCFSEDWSVAQDIINMNFLIGIGGIITYPKNEYLRNVVINDKLEHIVLETDAPFLPPQQIRGKKNSPAEIKTIAEFIANLLDIDLQNVAKKTTINAHNLFGIS